MEQNKGVLSGKFTNGEFLYSHERSGEYFYRNTISVERLSGTRDEIPVLIPGKLIGSLDPNIGEFTLFGSFRSRNYVSDGKSRLQIYFFVDQISQEKAANPNCLHLEGYICKPPVYRLTPFGREITDLLLAVNRKNGVSDYLPCVAWGNNAKWAGSLQVGSKLAVDGRMQSRNFTKKGDPELNTRVAYEVSVSSLSLEN